MIGGGIIVPSGQGRSKVRFVSRRDRADPQDFSPWQGIVCECGPRGPQIRTLESMKPPTVAAIRVAPMNLTPAESLTLWMACTRSRVKGSGRVRRALKAVAFSNPDSEYVTAAEFIQRTRLSVPRIVPVPKVQAVTAEGLYREQFGEPSMVNLSAGWFLPSGDQTQLTPGVYLGWAVSAERTAKLLGSLEKGLVDHVFWLWQPE